ncbi:hypothetical protein TTRE_0000722801 [Trichuris trichiura]|uniref:DNAJC9 HTH domain-containing protein n=1 Tax=Trichuris trichiura TaxID=36087 RepID=A0A077ZES8_TRITR|nr:hypothetical protein TTRE_0000722801 [Trichuris trichiura]
MDCIMESLIMSEIEDEPRYRRIIDRLIEAGEVELYDDYANEPAEKAKSRRERWMRESKELQKRCAVGNTGTNFPSLPELFNAQKRECNTEIFSLLLEKYRKTEQQEEVSERPTSSKAVWKIEDQPKLVKQQSEKRVKLEAPEAKTNTKKGWPHKVSKEKEGRRAEEKDEEKNYAGNVMRTRYRERLAQKLLEEQQSPQLRSKEKVSARSNVVNGIGERTQRKRGRSSNKRRKKSEHKRDVPTNQQTKSKAVGRGRKTVQKRRGKEKKESIDKQQSTRKAELQDRKYGNSNGGKNMKLANSKKRRIKNAKTSLTTRKERGKSMRATDEDANDKSKHSGKFEKAEGSKPSKSSRRSKRKRRWFRSR